MKQGRSGSDVYEPKVEPKAKAYSPEAAAQIGVQVARTMPLPSAGRGFNAPAPKAETQHRSGSQGKYK